MKERENRNESNTQASHCMDNNLDVERQYTRLGHHIDAKMWNVNVQEELETKSHKILTAETKFYV